MKWTPLMFAIAEAEIRSIFQSATMEYKVKALLGNLNAISRRKGQKENRK
jgi:hypothetical protein